MDTSTHKVWVVRLDGSEQLSTTDSAAAHTFALDYAQRYGQARVRVACEGFSNRPMSRKAW